jgi:hypothetical protein
MTQDQQKHRQEEILDRRPQKCLKELQTNRSSSSEVIQRIELINNLMVQIFLDPKDIGTHNVLPYIFYLLRKFNLDGYFSEFDVLIEAYTIAISKTKEGYIIKNPTSWFKGTALMIIRNLKRESKKQDSVKKKLRKEETGIDKVDSLEFTNELEPVLVAFKNLREEDRYILTLRIVKGLTWSSIAERMIDEGKEDSVFSAELLVRLRKRCQRALDRLRVNYGQK